MNDRTDIPVKINPDTFYTKVALERALAGVVSVKRFLLRVRPPQKFKGVYWGADLIEAIAVAPSLGEDDGPGRPSLLAAHRARKRKRGKAPWIDPCIFDEKKTA